MSIEFFKQRAKSLFVPLLPWLALVFSPIFRQSPYFEAYLGDLLTPTSGVDSALLPLSFALSYKADGGARRAQA